MMTWRRIVSAFLLGALLSVGIQLTAQHVRVNGVGSGGSSFDQDLNTTDSPTFAGVTVNPDGETPEALVNFYENGASILSLLDLVADDSSTIWNFRAWNKTATSDGSGGFTVYQDDGGAVYVGGETTTSFGGSGPSAVTVSNPDNWTPGHLTWESGSLPGIWIDAGHGILQGQGDGLNDHPAAPSVANVGTPGAQTVSYKLVGTLGPYTKPDPDYYHRSAASSAGTTTTAHATLDDTNFNRLTITWPTGAGAIEVYRTVGGPSQGLIATITDATLVAGAFTFDDTGLAGDASTPPSTPTEGWKGYFVSLTGLYVVKNFVDGKSIVAETSITAGTTLRAVPVAVGSLPTCDSTTAGSRASVTDSNAASFTAGIGAVVANGGSTKVPVYCDGTNWRIG